MAWFALFVQNEFKALRDLDEAGIDVYLPTIARYTRNRYAPKDKPFTRHDEPIFPRYIFAETDPDALGEVVRTARAVYAVGSGGIARAIPGEIMDMIRETVASGALDEAEPVIPEKRKRIRYKGMQALRVWLDANRPKAPVRDVA